MNITIVFAILLGLVLRSGCADSRGHTAALLETPVPHGATALASKSGPDGCWYWCVLQLTPEQAAVFSNTVQQSASWQRMPLPPELLAASNYLQPRTSEFHADIPLTNTNGFYTFIDQHERSAARFSSSRRQMKEPFYQRGGVNIVFGYYDDIARKIYVWYAHT